MPDYEAMYYADLDCHRCEGMGTRSYDGKRCACVGRAIRKRQKQRAELRASVSPIEQLYMDWQDNPFNFPPFPIPCSSLNYALD